MTTPYHSQYWAHALTLRGSGGDIAALSRSIANARVDLNPHQIDAALFAVRSPFTNGAILADEVGLGKTVEAGIVLAQKWAERRRRILIIVPAILRNQWQQELDEKFFLPSEVLDGRVFNRLQKTGQSNPFDQTDKVVICSYNFAAAVTNGAKLTPYTGSILTPLEYDPHSVKEGVRNAGIGGTCGDSGFASPGNEHQGYCPGTGDCPQHCAQLSARQRVAAVRAATRHPVQRPARQHTANTRPDTVPAIMPDSSVPTVQPNATSAPQPMSTPPRNRWVTQGVRVKTRARYEMGESACRNSARSPRSVVNRPPGTRLCRTPVV